MLVLCQTRDDHLTLLRPHRKKLSGLDARMVDFGWDLNQKDRTMTFLHLTSMTSGYGRPEAPGAAWAYNDYARNLYQKTLFDRVFQQARFVLDRWQLAGFGTMASGFPSGVGFTTVENADLTGGGDGGRINVRDIAQLAHGDRTFTRWFNPTVFSRPAQGLWQRPKECFSWSGNQFLGHFSVQELAGSKGISRYPIS